MALFTIRIFKSFGARDPERRWVNNYEVEAAGDSPLDAIDTLDTIVAAERLLHYNFIHFLSATISTWEPDSKPYNPEALASRELTGQGSRIINNGAPMDSNICLSVKFVPAVGLLGRRFYRGCLSEEEVQTGGDGKMTIVPGDQGNPVRQAHAAFNTALASVLAQGTGSPGIKMVTNPPVVLVRDVLTTEIGGVTIASRNHRYFDRA
jgi:hypothetical protein